MSCNPICNNTPWTPVEKTIVASTIVLIVSAVALAVIFYAANPLAHSKYMALVYADASLGGLAILTLAIGLVFKYCSTGASKTSNVPFVQEGDAIVNAENNTLAIDEHKLKETVVKDWDAIHADSPPERIIKHAGKHMRVVEHAEFPGLIIKLPRPQLAQEMYACLERSQQVLKEHPEIKHCMVPATKVIPLNENHSLFVMEKVQGSASYQAQEISEQAYEQVEKDANLEMKWRSYFRDAAEFICLTGYWDTSWNNIILMQNGFGFVDYESLAPTPQHLLTGISRLLEMAPPQFADMIIQIASKYGISSEQLCEELRVKRLETFKIERRQRLELRSKVRLWQKTHPINHPTGKIDGTRWNADSIEGKIIEQFNKETARLKEFVKHNPIAERKLWWQPLTSLSIKREQFEAALKNLQTDGIVCDWTTKAFGQPELLGYHIYF